jgi:hypothetical protein
LEHEVDFEDFETGNADIEAQTDCEEVPQFERENRFTPAGAFSEFLQARIGTNLIFCKRPS